MPGDALHPGHRRFRHPRTFGAAGCRTYFLTGLIVAGPLTITIYITWWFITLIDGWVKPLVPADYPAGRLPALLDPRLRVRHRLPAA